MKFHSIIDVITNSSSSVYVWPYDDAIQETKKFLTSIAKIFAFEGNIDDYVEVRYDLSQDYIEAERDCRDLGDDFEEDTSEFMNAFRTLLKEKEMTLEEYNLLPYDDHKKLWEEFRLYILDLYVKGQYTDLKYEGNHRYLKIILIPKNGEAFDLWDSLGFIFGIDVHYDY